MSCLLRPSRRTHTEVLILSTCQEALGHLLGQTGQQTTLPDKIDAVCRSCAVGEPDVLLRGTLSSGFLRRRSDRLVAERYGGRVDVGPEEAA